MKNCTLSTQERILAATLELIAEHGCNGVTIKKIAELADVNIAAVNYHFGSKDRVIGKALREMAMDLIHCFDVLEQKLIPPRARLKQFLLDYSKVSLGYPDLFRAFLNHCTNDVEIPLHYMSFLANEGFDKIKNVVLEAGVKLDEDTIKMRVFQMVSALEFPILLGKQLRGICDIDYNDKTVRNKYMDILIETLLRD